MAHYIYVPVPTQEMKERASSLKKTCEKRHKMKVLKNVFDEGRRKGVARFFGGGCLSGVEPGDTLYFLLHGGGLEGRKDIVFANRHAKRTKLGWDEGDAKGQKGYTPEQVAALLEKEGLKKTFVDLHMLTCGGALPGMDVDAFAERVCRGLKEIGYKRIQVTGYKGDVLVSRMGWISDDWFTVRIGQDTVPAEQAAVVYT